MQLSASAVMVRLLATVSGLGATRVDETLSRWGLTRAEIELPGARVDHQVILDLLEAGHELDPCFGLHAAEQLGSGTLQVVDFIARSSSTFRAGLERVARYRKLLGDGLLFDLTPRGTQTFVRFDLEPRARPSSALVEFGVATLFVGLFAIGLPVTGEVHFKHARPADTREYERIFRVPIHFGAAENGGLFDSALLARSNPSANPALGSLLEKHADQLLDCLPRESDLSERVRRLVLGELHLGSPSFERVAEQLRMSPRTLRRRLTDQNASFHELVDRVRRELAFRYVGESSLRAEDLASLLGFSDANAYRRAFKRWTVQAESPRQLAK